MLHFPRLALSGPHQLISDEAVRACDRGAAGAVSLRDQVPAILLELLFHDYAMILRRVAAARQWGISAVIP
jgi:hypothetical protein